MVVVLAVSNQNSCCTTAQQKLIFILLNFSQSLLKMKDKTEKKLFKLTFFLRTLIFKTNQNKNRYKIRNEAIIIDEIDI